MELMEAAQALLAEPVVFRKEAVEVAEAEAPVLEAEALEGAAQALMLDWPVQAAPPQHRLVLPAATAASVAILRPAVVAPLRLRQTKMYTSKHTFS